MRNLRILLTFLCIFALAGTAAYIYGQRSAVDTEAPVLEAASEELMVSISATDEELMEGITATDDVEGDISDRIIIETISKSTDGEDNEFEITYVAFDDAGNAGRLTRTLIYTDYQQAHFSLTDRLRLPQNGSWSLFDYITVEDCLDGDLTPFLVIEGSDTIQSDSAAGFYECTLSVTNSAGDTTELTIQVEIYENSYEERYFRPTIYLTDYLVYVEEGDFFDPENYLDYVSDSGTWLIDYGKMVKVETGEDGEYELVTEKEANGEAGNWLNVSEIGITSNVDTETPGTYSVVYTYTSKSTAYECSVELIVVVE